MLCENCKKREANVRYSENINGKVKQMNLCEECSQKLGIGNIDFNMPIDFSSFFGGFMEDFTMPEFLPLVNEIKTLKCNECGFTFDDIVNTGRLGCGNCYDVFGDRLDPIIKKIQGNNRHVGRLGKIMDNHILNDENYDSSKNVDTKKSKLELLKEDLKKAVQEERYEDAAKIRDEIAKLS